MTPVRRIFEARVRGFRLVELVGGLCLVLMVFSVYLAKAGAAEQAGQIADLEQRIAAERHRLRLLRAETARLEQPARLEALSRVAGLEPVAVTRQIPPAALAEVAPTAAAADAEAAR